MAFLIRIEGCDFGATLYDTNDSNSLSVVRGASRAYLRAPGVIGQLLAVRLGRSVREIVIGASDGIFQIASDPDVTIDRIRAALHAAATAAADEAIAACLPHLSFTFGVVEQSADYRTDVLRLIAQCRAGQLQRRTTDLPDIPDRMKLGAAAELPCKVDHIRPIARTDYPLPGAQGRTPVSASVEARREYGRKQRREFYAEELGHELENGGQDLAVVDSFQDLVSAPPAGLPPSLQNKMAVVYLDGNKMTAIREALVFGPGGETETVIARQQAFSAFVRTARRSMLKGLLDHLASQDGMIRANVASGADKGKLENQLRFETLLWGGDESLFVLPAWPVLDMLPQLCRTLEDPIWQHQGYKVSQGIGVLICNVKTPIIVVKKLAQSLADSAKPLAKVVGADGKTDIANLRNVLSVQILESIEPPHENLDAFRQHLYGTKEARVFTLVGQEIAALPGLVAKFKQEPGGLPRSQLFGLINTARTTGAFRADADTKTREAMEGAIVEAFRRSKCKVALAEFRAPLLGYSTDTPFLPLIRLAELWDYVDPLGRTLGSAARKERAA